MNKKTIRVIILSCMFLLALITLSVNPYAKSKTTKLKGVKYSIITADVEKNAATVKKGTHKIGMSKGHGYLRFKAQKNRTYKFTVSNLKSSKNNYQLGYFVLMTGSTKWGDDYLQENKVKTYGGSNTRLRFATRNGKGKKKNRYLKSRTGSLKLKKGQTMYVYIYSSGKVTFDFRIK